MKEEDIILYGQSIGSGPTLELATKLPQIRGVILQSAILSGLRVMYRIKYSLWLDIYKVSRSFSSIELIKFLDLYVNCDKFSFFFFFCFLQNIDKIPYVSCPILVIHVSLRSQVLVVLAMVSICTFPVPIRC